MYIFFYTDKVSECASCVNDQKQMASIVRNSAVASLVAQFVLGVVTSMGFFVDVDVPQTRADLDVILPLEVASQVIEFLWYVTVLARARAITARLRYVDWVLSTPVMLVSLAMFFRHRAATHSSVVSIFETYEVYVSLGANWAMLACGFAMESDAIPDLVGLLGGGLALVVSFTLLATLVPDGDPVSATLFWVTFGVWGLYGVAAALDAVTKNVMYNTIDVVSKNGFGLFLFIYTLTRND